MTAHTATITTTDAGLLRFALRLDAAITAANGAAYLALCWLLDGGSACPPPSSPASGRSWSRSRRSSAAWRHRRRPPAAR